jgi:rhodanese-related sulfurtransferase
VALVRLVPLLPFNLLNYALGPTRIRLDHHILASLLAMLPGTIAYTWLGYAGREAAAGSETAVRNLLLALSLVALVAFLPRLLRRLCRVNEGCVAADDLKRQLDQDRQPLVIDLCGAEEFTGVLGHIPGARNIPLDDLPAHLAELEPARRRGLTLVCRTDKRSAKAAELLRRAGFADVTILRGGMEEWNRQGFEIAHRADP